MSFLAPKGLRAFVKNVEARDGARKFILFDGYYCALLAGLDARKLGQEDDYESDPFINNYPDDYKGQADIIAGLLIDAELDRMGIEADNKISIEREMTRLVNPASPTHLSGEGLNRVNRYAASGFKQIQDSMMPPSNLEEFLVAFHAYWHREQTPSA